MSHTIKRLFSKALFLLLPLLCFLQGTFPARAQFYEGTKNTFGKTGVQYIDFLWNLYRYENFDIYFYLGGNELSQFAARVAERELHEVEKILDYKLSGRMQIVLYNKLSDLKQTNIGAEDQQYNTGGYTKMVGSKVFIYFDGNHETFRRNIRAAVAQMLVEQILYGGDLRDRLQNAALLSLPAWYVQGLVSYIAEGWNTHIDDRLRDGFLTGKYRKFNRLTGTDAIYAGHSIWNYIVDVYGESALSNLLYMTRINRNIESGLVFVLGVSLKTMSRNWVDYYEKKYLNADAGKNTLMARSSIKKKTRPGRIYGQIKISPSGRYVAFTMNNIGRYKAFVYDTLTRKTRTVVKGGYKSLALPADASFPVMAWHPGGKILSAIREHKGQILLGNYEVEQKKFSESPLLNYEKVLSFSYSDSGDVLLLSAVQRGQTDIFVYNLRTFITEQITRDFYDDLYPRFIHRSRDIVFSSNRTNDTLKLYDGVSDLPPSSDLDLFIYDYKNKSTILKRFTNTPDENEIFPVEYDSLHIAYLSDENGIYNRFIGHLDSTISYIDTAEHYRYEVTSRPVTNYSRNIRAHDISYRSGTFAEIIFTRGKHRIFTGRTAANDSIEPVIPLKLEGTPYKKTALKTKQRMAEKKADTVSVVKPRPPVNTAPPDSNKIDINNYVFQNEFSRGRKKQEEKKQDAGPPMTAADSAKKEQSDSLKSLIKYRLYKTIYNTNYFVSQIDNGLLNETYQTFTGGGYYFLPGLNALFKLGISDVMEDYRITGAFRNSIETSSTEYYLSFENLKERLDKQVIFYRQGSLNPTNYGATIRVHTYELKYRLRYPLNDITSLRGTATYRNDRSAYLSTDLPNLMKANKYENWVALKAEYVFDNTIPTGLNLYNGTRFKIFAEAFRQIDHNPRALRGDNPWLFRGLINQDQKTKAVLYVVGVDFRNYLKVHRDIIWANRFAASASLGTRKLLYYLGGLDNWLIGNGIPKFNDKISIDYSQNYAYQAVATNLRGFQQNIRNGSNFAVINSEFRIPLFKYLIRRPLKSDFFRNFQVAAFGDVGTAWSGLSPYSAENSLNKEVIIDGPITVTLENPREPIVGGYGFGLRSRVFGYFIRTDWAWGVEDGQVNDKPIFYLSLSLDF